MKNQDSLKAIGTKLVFCMVMVYVLVSCSPNVNVSSDYDRTASFSEYKSFSINRQKTIGRVSQLNEDRITRSIRAEMTKKGFVEVKENPDLKVNAATVVKNKQSLSLTSNNYARPYGYWGAARTGHASVRPQEYKEGTLVIEAVDAKKGKVVWTAAGNGELTRKPDNPDEAIATIVAKIFTEFPIANK
jgi:Domain of unknown function (DUF4136)